MRLKLIVPAVAVPAFAGLWSPSRPVSAQAERPTFEVASVRANTSEATDPFPTMQLLPRRFAVTWTSLRELIFLAYALPIYQTVEGDDPLLDARFDVEATASVDIPPPVPGEVGPLNLMMQGLLAERFSLVVRWEDREQLVYLLTLAGDDVQLGSHLRASTCPPPYTVRPAPAASAPGIQGTARCGSSSSFLGGMQALGQTMSSFARLLSLPLDAPVRDRTGVEGVFDIVDLSFDSADLPRARDLRSRFGGPGAATAPSSTADKLSLFTALEEDLGLKLESAREPVPVLIVEHVEPPTPN